MGTRPPGPAAPVRTGPEPGGCRSLTGAGARSGGGTAVVPAPVVPLSQAAGDTVGLMDALGIDRADVSGGSGGGRNCPAKWH